HPEHVKYLSNLVFTLQLRYERMGLLTDLDEAVEMGREAVRRMPPDHPERGVSLNNLGIAVRTRFERLGAVGDLDEAVEVGREAVRAMPADHPEHVKYLSNLVFTLQLRYERMGLLTDLDEAVEMGREAVRRIPPDHPQRVVSLNNLGIAVRTRFERLGAVGDLDEAVEVGREAVRAISADQPDRAKPLTTLGNALLVRFTRTGQVSDLDEAVEVGRQAVRAVSADHPGRARTLCIWGNALSVRFGRTGTMDDRNTAASVFAEAAGVESAAPSIRINAARAAASLWAVSEPARAAALLEKAVELLPLVAPRRLERPDQQHALGAFGGIAADAAALTLADPGLPSHARPARALRLLEAARAVMLSQALRTRGDVTELRERHPDLAARFVELREVLDGFTGGAASAVMTSADQTPADAARQTAQDGRRLLAEEFTALLEHIRTLNGFAHFALPPTTGQLLEQAVSGPVVVFSVSNHRSDALLLTSGGVTALTLPGLTLAAVIDQVNAFHQALSTAADTTAPRAARADAEMTIQDVLGWLWDEAAGPVLAALGYHQPPAPGEPWPRVWWVPGGVLSLLPVHAAGHHTGLTDPQHRTVLDRVVSSYTPTVGALRHARQRSAARGTASHRGLIVAMPTTPGLSGHGDLPNVTAEAAKVRARLPDSVVLSEPGGTTPADPGRLPTTANVLTHLSRCAIAHFACHGVSDPADPSNSRVLLHDHQTDPLTVTALVPIALDHARLAYLSACGTALTATVHLLDEAIHLASVFQLAGFPHVVATLWPINDAVAVTIATAFYTALTTADGTLDTDQAACALHRSVRAIRAAHLTTPSLWAAYIHAGA
ncbi:CHAT domain-containing tetratricopeptide repeat protein, partial [Sphaerisporangium sp. B11E5]|uniref:CHAT domain-containing tetratricopeptide repeat protein n=1 Tax=Sphaerisporangium sp. B11E5 TaxID=3153563 RepID=UPI00325D3402